MKTESELVRAIRQSRVILTANAAIVIALRDAAISNSPPVGFNQSEVCANITLAYRHLEDASMRLGKAIQAADGGKSCYDDSTAPTLPPVTTVAEDLAARKKQNAEISAEGQAALDARCSAADKSAWADCPEPLIEEEVMTAFRMLPFCARADVDLADRIDYARAHVRIQKETVGKLANAQRGSGYRRKDPRCGGGTK